MATTPTTKTAGAKPATSGIVKGGVDMSALKGSTPAPAPTPASAAPATAAAKPATAAPATAAPATAAAKPAATPAKAKPATKAKAKAKPATKATTKATTKGKAKAKPAAKPAAKKAAPPPPKKTPTVPPGAEGNSKTEENKSNGSNSALSEKELAKAADAVAENLAGVMNADKRIDKAKADGDTLRKQAAEVLFPIFDRLGLEPDWGKDFAKKAKEFAEYNQLQKQVCENLSKRVRDKVEFTAKGAPIFSSRVKKAWSRLNTSYKEGGDGGSTEADNNAREAAKARAKTNTAKAEMMDHIVIAHAEGDTDKVEGLLGSAKAQWGKALGV